MPIMKLWQQSASGELNQFPVIVTMLTWKLAILLALETAGVPIQLSSTLSLSVPGVIGKGCPSSPGKNK